MEEIVTEEYLISKGFELSEDEFGWSKYRKNGFELLKIPLTKGGFVINFEFEYRLQTRYKYPLNISELSQLYNILTGNDL